MALYGKVEIKDLNDNVYTLGSENRGYSVGLYKDKAHAFKLQVADPQDTFKEKYVVGGEVTVYCDSNNPPTTKIFNGIIENVSRRDLYGTRVLDVESNEKFFIQAMGILVTDRFSNKKAGWIARTLVSNYTSGFTTSNMQDTDTELQSRTFKMRPLKECLDRLAEAAGAIWYCTSDGDVYFHPKETIESGLSLTESMVEGTPKVLKSLTEVYTVVEVHGGVSLELDQSQQTYSGGSVLLHDRDVAIKFSPTKSFGRFLELYVDKVGSPGRALSGRIVEDKNGEPSGPSREFFAYSEAQIDAAGWHGVKIDFPIDVVKDYWIVLNRAGDISNTYRWYHDGGTAGSHGEKTDGTWSIVSSSWEPAFKIYGGNPVIGKAIDPEGYKLYGRREYIVEREDITHKEEAVTIARNILAEKSTVRLEFEKLRVRGDQLTSIPQPGQLANLTLSPLNFDGKVILEDIEIEFPAGSEAVEEVVFTVGQDPESLAQTLKRLEEKLEEEKRKGIGDEVLLNLSVLFQESLPLAESLTAWTPGTAQHPIFNETVPLSDSVRNFQQARGTFIAGVARAGYSDAA